MTPTIQSLEHGASGKSFPSIKRYRNHRGYVNKNRRWSSFLAKLAPACFSWEWKLSFSKSFRDLLVELSQDTQFVIITHNRNTVQAADVIYGITMGRDSASQMISLKLDEVTEEMLRRA